MYVALFDLNKMNQECLVYNIHIKNGCRQGRMVNIRTNLQTLRRF